MMITASTQTTIVYNSLRRGFDASNSQLAQDEAILPPNELARAYRARREQLLIFKNEIHELLDRPSKNTRSKWAKFPHKRTPLISLYLETGKKIIEIQSKLSVINKVTREKGISFSQIFLGVARATLSPQQFQQLYELTLFLSLPLSFLSPSLVCIPCSGKQEHFHLS